jgi:Na+/alanine symporter
MLNIKRRNKPKHPPPFFISQNYSKLQSIKEKKKPTGTKAEIRAYKKRSRRIGTAVMVAILVVVIAFSSFLIYSYINSLQSNYSPPATLELKAAIFDQLSLHLVFRYITNSHPQA